MKVQVRMVVACSMLAALAACETPQPSAPFETVLDRTITDAEGVTLSIASDGTYTGTAPGNVSFGGTWDLEGGQWCENLNRRSGEVKRTCYDYNVQSGGVAFTEAGEAPRFFAF
ncbi:hypothetical protein [Tropicimonas sp. S265A]|uniref:hypothetical protein n=1 Tax=Tropicimonas sp. S265A TaxID=3415134 RepID=UPI003C7B135B